MGPVSWLPFRTAGERVARRRRELLEALHVARSEAEALEFLKRHGEGSVPAAALSFVVEAESCTAARLRRDYDRPDGSERLVPCDRCGSSVLPSVCIPLTAGPDVLGAVLIERRGGIDGRHLEELRESVLLAAPFVANLRNLAAAEARAATDALTGLPNSRALRETLKHLVALSGRTVSPLSAILFDLDHFKRVNDTWGHERGDDALAAVGEILTSTVRASDYAGRYGGEEFLVLLPDTDRDGAVNVAEKLRQAIANATVPGVDRPLSASFGVASLPADGGEGDALVRLAERALHAAKTAGRNRVEAAGLSVARGPEDG
jgi:diguanylate cyclase (GGDEF)-like protein